MSSVVIDDATKADAASKPAIMVWFDWAQRLTTGLGTHSELQAHEANNMDAVVLSIASAMHNNKSGVHVPAHIAADYERTGEKPPEKLVINAGSVVAIETIGLFLLERLAERDSARAFDLAEDLRMVSGRGVFASQLALFQMSLIDGNEALALRNAEPFGNKVQLVMIANTQRSIRPDSPTGMIYGRANQLMHSYFKPSSPSIAA